MMVGLRRDACCGVLSLAVSQLLVDVDVFESSRCTVYFPLADDCSLRRHHDGCSGRPELVRSNLREIRGKAARQKAKESRRAVDVASGTTSV